MAQTSAWSEKPQKTIHKNHRRRQDDVGKGECDEQVFENLKIRNFAHKRYLKYWTEEESAKDKLDESYIV